MPNNAKKTWVTTFDGQLGRVYEKGKDGNLHHLAGEGMDARPNQEDRRDTGSLHNADLRPGGDIDFMTEEQFVDRFADHLARRARAGAFDRLIVSAAPKALASFRRSAPDALKEKVTVELNKDYTHTPIKEFEAALEKQL